MAFVRRTRAWQGLLILVAALVCAAPRSLSAATVEPAVLPGVPGVAESYNLQGQRWKLGKPPIPSLQKPRHEPIYLDEAMGAGSRVLESRAGRPELFIRTGHSFEVVDLALAPDGAWFATAGGRDGSVRIWDAGAETETRAIGAHTNRVNAVAVSPDGKFLASGSNDRTAKIWEVRSGRLVREIKVDPYAMLEMTARFMGEVRDLDFSPDGRHIVLATGSDPRIFDLSTGAEVLPLRGHTNDVAQVRYSPNGQLIATGASDVRLWDAGTGKMLRILQPAEGLRKGLSFSPDGELLAAIVRESGIGRARVWRVSTGERLMDVAADGPGRAKQPLAVQFSRDGRLLAVSFANAVRLVNMRDSQDIAVLAREGLEPRDLAFGPDGNTLYLATGKSAEKWELSTRRRTGHYVGQVAPVLVTSADPSRRFLYTVFMSSEAVEGDTGFGLLWDMDMGGVRRRGPPSGVRNQAAAIDRNQELVVAGYVDGRLRAWRVADGRLTLDVAAHQMGVWTVAISSDAALIATASEDKSVKLWDARGGKLLRSLTGHDAMAFSLDFSDDGKQLASGSMDKTVRVWSTSDGRLLHTFKHDDPVQKVAFSPDGKWLATVQSFVLAGRQIKLWDLQAAELSYLLLDANVSWNAALEFSPDSRRLALGRSDNSVALWQIGTGTFARIASHTASVHGIEFSTAGELLFTASGDGSVGVSDLRDGRQLANLVSLPGTTDWVAVTPDGLFDGTPGAWSKLAWRFEGETFNIAPLEIFFNDFYYPGLLSDLVAGRRPTAPADIARMDRRQPAVALSVLQAAVGPKIEQRTARVRVAVRESVAGGNYPKGSGARDVRLFRNGSLVKVWRGDVAGSKGATVLDWEVPLVAGVNRLHAYGFSASNIKSADATLQLTGAESLRRPARLIIVGIGIDQYANSEFNLSFAVTDVDAFLQEVKEQQRRLGHFSVIEEVRLVDDQANRANILARLQRLQDASPEDVLMVYFAGHGTTDGERFYMLPHDLGYVGKRAELDQQGLEKILTHAISDRELADAFEQIDAGQILFFVDACNSGQALEAGERRKGPMNAKGLAQLAYDKGMNIITAAQGYQLANEHSALGHGFLTYALVEEGLKTPKADLAPRDNLVTVREWLDFAAARVPEIHSSLLSDGDRGLKRKIDSAAPGDQEQWQLQQPRVFYRREAQAEGFVVSSTAR